MPSLFRTVGAVIAGTAVVLGAVARAADGALSLPGFFTDHMVLQQGMKVPVWGRGAPGVKVAVAFRGQTQEAVVDARGTWQVTLAPLAVSTEGADLVVTQGAESRNVTDVVVGEVWFASGQSNMNFPLKNASGAAAAIAAAALPQVRFFLNKVVLAAEPGTDTVGRWPTWCALTPQNAGEVSAVAFFFARELQKARPGVPVGILQSAYDWTPAEAWTPRGAMLADPDLACIVERWDAGMAAFAAWQQDCQKAKTENRAVPAQPKGSADPNFAHRPAGLFNGAVHPFIPYAIRGVIWYQGETNDNRGIQYRKLFPALISSWRQAWGQGEIPFLFVQLASVLPPPDPVKDPRWFDSEWSEVREAQALTLRLPHTGMAVALDLGEEKDVHPKNKFDVGLRLALAARAVAYGEKIPFAGPRFVKLTVAGDKAHLAFDHVASGLATRDGKDPAFFYIAGTDRKFVPAQARLEGDTVVVWSDQVKVPVAVRYAWANNALAANLCNRAGLPAIPFRTDDWPGKSTGVTRMFIDPPP